MVWIILFAFAGLGLALFGFHPPLTRAAAREWIHYRNGRGSLGSYGQAFIAATSTFVPEIEHIVERQ